MIDGPHTPPTAKLSVRVVTAVMPCSKKDTVIIVVHVFYSLCFFCISQCLAGDTSRGARNEEQKLTVLHFALPSSSLYYVHLRSQYDPATTSTVVDHS